MRGHVVEACGEGCCRDRRHGVTVHGVTQDWLSTFLGKVSQVCQWLLPE